MIIDLRSCDGCQSVGKPPQCTTACIEGHFAPEPMEWIQVFEGELPGWRHAVHPDAVPAVPEPALRQRLPGGRHVLHSRGDGAHRPEPLHRLPHLHGGLPLRPAVLQLGHARRCRRSRAWRTTRPEHQVPAKRGTVMKCDFCPDMARAGTLPYCAQGCPNQRHLLRRPGGRHRHQRQGDRQRLAVPLARTRPTA